MKTNKKQNQTLRIGLVALFLCVLSLALAGGTLAKYITTSTKSDSARVAKWGVEVEISNSDGTTDFFKASYQKDSSNTEIGVNSVNSTGGTDKVLAPGTTGKINFSIKGQPEVAFEFLCLINNTKYTGWQFSNQQSDKYDPVKFKLEKNGEASAVIELTDFNDFVSKFNAHFATKTNYDANSLLNLEYTITWLWAFDGDDVKDTYLGNLEVAPVIEFTLDIKATQLD